MIYILTSMIHTRGICSGEIAKGRLCTSKIHIGKLWRLTSRVLTGGYPTWIYPLVDIVPVYTKVRYMLVGYSLVRYTPY